MFHTKSLEYASQLIDGFKFVFTEDKNYLYKIGFISAYLKFNQPDKEYFVDFDFGFRDKFDEVEDLLGELEVRRIAYTNKCWKSEKRR